jgi:hypothetical protein
METLTKTAIEIRTKISTKIVTRTLTETATKTVTETAKEIATEIGIDSPTDYYFSDNQTAFISPPHLLRRDNFLFTRSIIYVGIICCY